MNFSTWADLTDAGIRNLADEVFGIRADVEITQAGAVKVGEVKIYFRDHVDITRAFTEREIAKISEFVAAQVAKGGTL